MKRYKFSDIAYNITEKKMPVPGDEKLYIGLEHLDSGSLQVSRWGGDIELKGEKLVMRKGDILFGRRNTYLRRAAIAPHDGIFSAHGMIYRPKTDVVDPGFFPFFIASDYFMDEAIRISVGSLSPTVNWGTLKNLEFNLPDIPEQQQYAKLLAAFERTKEAYKKLISATDDLVKSQFIERFIHGERYPSVRLDAVSTVSSGLTKNAKRPTFEIKMPYLRVANVFFDYIDLDDVQTIGVQQGEIEKTMLKKGDVLFVEGNGSPDQIGRVAVWDGQSEPMLHQNHIIKARPDERKVLSKYCMYFFMTQAGRNQILSSAKTTSGLYTLSLSKIAGFKLPLAPLEEQQRFLQLVEQSDKSKYLLRHIAEAFTIRENHRRL